MTSQLTPKTLGGLEFSDIKKSLTNYLKTQDIFSGYAFEGSAMQTIIDMLSYNTFYYAYYANMINAEAFLDSAQKEDSVISLCKPLGYFVPSAKCATAVIRVGGITNTSILAGTVFTSKNSEGVPYKFYTLENIIVDEGSTDEFKIYEGTKYIQFDAFANFDLDDQSISIANTNFDINTLTVTVTEGTDTASEWKLVSNIGYTSQINENIYFVERTSSGFVIKFGLKNSLGNTIDDSVSSIVIRYLTTSGSAANGLNLFNTTALSGNVGVVTMLQASGGLMKPNLDDVRFLAPRWFASQERAVTVNDYKALLINSGYFANDSDFNVYGGQDLYPPRYGRVFISSSLELSETAIISFIDFIKDRSVITVLPEFTIANTLSVFVDFTFKLMTDNTITNRNKAKQLLKNIFDRNFRVTSKFNISFSSSEFIKFVEDYETNSTDKAILSSVEFSPDNFTLYVNQPIISGKEYVFNLGNELKADLQTLTDITEPFDYYQDNNANRKVVLRILSVSNSAKNNKAQLQLWAIDNDSGDEEQIEGEFGYCIVSKGVISIPKDVIKTSATLNVVFKKKSILVGFNNSVTFKSNTITAL